MYITKKHLSRRAILRGLGTAMSLPFLEAMVPACTALAATAAAPKPRMGFFYLPHGAIMDEWTPDLTGSNFELKAILKPLAAYKNQMTIVSGLGNKPAESSAVHAITPGTWLSCVAPERSHAPNGGITADQIAAQVIGQNTPLPSLEVATEAQGGAAACDGTYGCSYGNTIAFRTPNLPLPMEASPRRLFKKLFGQGQTPEERLMVQNDYVSILDMVQSEAEALKKQLGAQDRVRLEGYLDSVREIERRVMLTAERDDTNYDTPELPVGVLGFDQQLRIMFDMIALAYQIDQTRVATFMMAAEVSNQAYTHVGISDAFHPLSHHNNNPASIAKLVTLQAYHSTVFADFLQKLSEMNEGEGSVLDNSIFLYGSNMSNSDRHNHFPLPSLVVGGGAGALKGNQHLKYEDRTPLANLLLTLLRRADIDVDAIGDSTGELAEV